MDRLAYVSNESGTLQIYVRAFPDKGGGVYGEGRFLRSRQAAAVVRQADRRRRKQPDERRSRAAPDGKRIVALMPATEAKGTQRAQNHVVFLENFLDELRRKVPTQASNVTRW